MFRLNRHKSERLGERPEFKFSNFQAFKVPKGWDKLFVSVISIESGKTIAKSNKATVRSGTCQWTESLSESIPFSPDGGIKDLDECLFKIVISMGSGKPGILGEVVLNLADYIDSSDSGPLTLPLNKCNYGTILQVKIQYFNPRNRLRDGDALRATNSQLESLHPNNDDLDNKTDTSGNIYYRSAGSLSSLASYPDEPIIKDTILLASGSHCSTDSTESSVGRTNLSPRSSTNGSLYMGRQDSDNSHISPASSAGPADDLPRSNPSSFNSRASVSSTPHQWQDNTMQAAASGHAAASLRTSGSAKELLEAAEETIDELRDEAKMWERHSQKLKIDIEKLKKECSFKSKQQEEMDIELSAANNERDSLRREFDQLKFSLEELKKNWAEKENCKTEGILHSEKQLEDELKFLKVSNNTLTMQLNKSQEANIELVAILEELEETLEKQRLELANLTQLTSSSKNGEEMRDQMLVDIEAEWAGKLSAKEKEINKLEEKLSKVQNAPYSREMVCNLGNPELMQEIEDLRAKVEELERDCTELTEENLELIYKLKESCKDVDEAKDIRGSSIKDIHCQNWPDSSESDLRHLKFQICQLEDELRRRDMDGVIGTEPSTLQMDEMKKKCADLDIELQYFKDYACDLNKKLHECQVEVEEKILHLNELQQKLEHLEPTDLGCSDSATGHGLEILKSRISLEMPIILFEMNEQLQLALCHVRNLNNELDPIAENCNEISANFMISSGTDAASQEELIEDMLNGIIKLNSSLQAMVVECKEFLENTGDGVWEKNLISARAVDIMEDNIMEEKQKNEFVELKLRNEELESAFLLKEKEIDALEASMRELEDMISNIRREKSQVEETLAVAQRENTISSNCLDDVRNEMIILSSNVNIHVSANKMLERKSSEFEIGKSELELHISELENKNTQLSEHIYGLEAQLRYLADDKESSRLELEDYKSLVVNLKGEIALEQAEIEAQKMEHRKKLQEVQKQLSASQEESEALKRYNSKLQSTVESLVEESDSLQKQTGDLWKQKLEMHKQMSELEVELMELQEKASSYLSKVDFLETSLSMVQSDVTLTEESLALKLESMLHEQNDQKQKISQANVMLKQIDQEKMIEIENLKLEIVHLSTQVCSSQGERERMEANAVRKVSSLCLEKNNLESSLQEVQAKAKFYETQLQNLTRDSEDKVEELTNLLNTSKQSEEMLMADIERMQRITESLKSSEENFRRMSTELGLKLKGSDYEKQQILDDASGLKVQLQKVTQYQDEILTLKNSLEEAKFEKVKLEDLLRSVSKECEVLKEEKISFSDKISHLQKALHDSEDDRCSRVALKEKPLKLEADLSEREETSYAQGGMKNDINKITRVNSEYQRKIQCLEEEKGELMRKAQLLEKKLLDGKEEGSEEKVSVKIGDSARTNGHQDEDKMAQEFLEGMPSLNAGQGKGLIEIELLGNMEGHKTLKDAALESNIHSLQTELAQALEANNVYQMQLDGFLSKEKSSQTETSNSNAGGGSAKIDQATKISSLEAELKDMKERYLHMSLQFAEVEAQREQLVMQLKSTKKEKRWFS